MKQFLEIFAKLSSISLHIGFLLGLACFIALGGCLAGDGEGLDENGRPFAISSNGENPDEESSDEENSSGTANPKATFNWIQTNVWSAVCIKCHAGGAPPRGLSWEEANSCNNVGKPSQEMAELNIIKQNDPDSSYLIWKIEGQGPNGDAIIGEQMPLNADPLSVDTIQNIRDWITDGAICP